MTSLFWSNQALRFSLATKLFLAKIIEQISDLHQPHDSIHQISNVSCQKLVLPGTYSSPNSPEELQKNINIIVTQFQIVRKSNDSIRKSLFLSIPSKTMTVSPFIENRSYTQLASRPDPVKGSTNVSFVIDTSIRSRSYSKLNSRSIYSKSTAGTQTYLVFRGLRVEPTVQLVQRYTTDASLGGFNLLFFLDAFLPYTYVRVPYFEFILKSEKDILPIEQFSRIWLVLIHHLMLSIQYSKCTVHAHIEFIASLTKATPVIILSNHVRVRV